MLYDPGARDTDPPSAGSPVAEAYNASTLPVLVVADRERMIRYLGSPRDREDAGVLAAVEGLVSQQP